MLIEARGYVNRPEAKTSKGGNGYSKFTLSVKQVEKAYGDRPEQVTRAFLDVTDYKNSSPPADGAYVTLKGFMKVRTYEKDGQKRQSLDVVAQELTVAPPLNSDSSGKGKAKPSDVEDDFPF